MNQHKLLAPQSGLHRFYPIFDQAEWLRRFVPLGIKFLQIRIKDTSPAQLRKETQDSLSICREHNCTLVLNDYWEFAIELGCPFVHLGQEDLDTADIAAIRKAGVKIGISTHDHDELERALSLNPDYIALGPVYPTLLKKMKWKQQGLERITEWKKRIGEIPLVAIGGMNPERARNSFAAGADIVSVVTDITLNADPESRVREWLSA